MIHDVWPVVTSSLLIRLISTHTVPGKSYLSLNGPDGVIGCQFGQLYASTSKKLFKGDAFDLTMPNSGDTVCQSGWVGLYEPYRPTHLAPQTDSGST